MINLITFLHRLMMPLKHRTTIERLARHATFLKWHPSYFNVLTKNSQVTWPTNAISWDSNSFSHFEILPSLPKFVHVLNFNNFNNFFFLNFNSSALCPWWWSFKSNSYCSRLKANIFVLCTHMPDDVSIATSKFWPPVTNPRKFTIESFSLCQCCSDHQPQSKHITRSATFYRDHVYLFDTQMSNVLKLSICVWRHYIFLKPF